MASAGGRRSASSGCCAFTFSSNVMPWLTKRSKMHSMTARRCALLPASTLSVEAVPDATTLLKFRHLLEAHDLTQRIFAEVGALLRERKLLMKEGTIVDATIIAAPSSTKNLARERDPEMHQTRKANQWYFGMKAHLGVDAHSGLVHTVTGTAANVADIAQTHALCMERRRKSMRTQAISVSRSGPRSRPAARAPLGMWRPSAVKSKR